MRNFIVMAVVLVGLLMCAAQSTEAQCSGSRSTGDGASGCAGARAGGWYPGKAFIKGRLWHPGKLLLRRASGGC